MIELDEQHCQLVAPNCDGLAMQKAFPFTVVWLTSGQEASRSEWIMLANAITEARRELSSFEKLHRVDTVEVSDPSGQIVYSAQRTW